MLVQEVRVCGVRLRASKRSDPPRYSFGRGRVAAAMCSDYLDMDALLQVFVTGRRQAES